MSLAKKKLKLMSMPMMTMFFRISSYFAGFMSRIICMAATSMKNMRRMLEMSRTIFHVV